MFNKSMLQYGLQMYIHNISFLDQVLVSKKKILNHELHFIFYVTDN